MDMKYITIEGWRNKLELVDRVEIPKNWDNSENAEYNVSFTMADDTYCSILKVWKDKGTFVGCLNIYDVVNILNRMILRENVISADRERAYELEQSQMENIS